MRIHMRKYIISTAVLGSLASATLLYSPVPAEAKKMTCQQKAKACERRCAAANKDFIACINRTCDRQYGTCG